MKNLHLLAIGACLLCMAACIKEPHHPGPQKPTRKLVSKITTTRFENGEYIKEVYTFDYNSQWKPFLVRIYVSWHASADTSNLVFYFSDSIFYDGQGRVKEAIRYDHMEGPDVTYGRRFTYAGNDTLPIQLAIYDSTINQQMFTDTNSMIYYPNEVVMIDHNEGVDDTVHATYSNGNLQEYGHILSYSGYDSAINIDRCFNMQHGLVMLLPLQGVQVPVLSMNNWRQSTGRYTSQVLTYDSLGYVTAIHRESPNKTVSDFRIEYINIE